MSEMICKRCGADENRIDGFCSIECRDKFYYEEDIRELEVRIAELGEEAKKRDEFIECLGGTLADNYTLKSRIAELEETVDQLIKVGYLGWKIIRSDDDKIDWDRLVRKSRERLSVDKVAEPVAKDVDSTPPYISTPPYRYSDNGSVVSYSPIVKLPEEREE